MQRKTQKKHFAFEVIAAELVALNIYLTTFSGVRYFGNKSAMSVIFFLKMLKI